MVKRTNGAWCLAFLRASVYWRRQIDAANFACAHQVLKMYYFFQYGKRYKRYGTCCMNYTYHKIGRQLQRE